MQMTYKQWNEYIKNLIPYMEKTNEKYLYEIKDSIGKTMSGDIVEFCKRRGFFDVKAIRGIGRNDRLFIKLNKEAEKYLIDNYKLS